MNRSIVTLTLVTAVAGGIAFGCSLPESGLFGFGGAAPVSDAGPAAGGAPGTSSSVEASTAGVGGVSTAGSTSASAGGVGGAAGTVSASSSDVSSASSVSSSANSSSAASSGAVSSSASSGCVATSCQAHNTVCGILDDGCGVQLYCGDCPQKQWCGGAGPGQCGKACDCELANGPGLGCPVSEPYGCTCLQGTPNSASCSFVKVINQMNDLEAWCCPIP